MPLGLTLGGSRELLGDMQGPFVHMGTSTWSQSPGKQDTVGRFLQFKDRVPSFLHVSSVLASSVPSAPLMGRPETLPTHVLSWALVPCFTLRILPEHPGNKQDHPECEYVCMCVSVYVSVCMGV